MNQKNNFLWGVATSSHQIEGNNTSSDWWEWEQQGNIEGGVSSGQACRFFDFMVEDLNRIQSLGCNSYRFSVEWAKVEPEPGQFNQQVLDQYSSLIEECLKRNIKPMLTLHHFTLPLWLAQKGGLIARNSTMAFIKYVEKILEMCEGRVELFCTLNEPMVLVSGAYLAGFMPPARFDPQSASQAIRKTLVWHVSSYDLIHAKLPGAKVGFAHNMIHFKADRKWHPLEILLSFMINKIYNYSWLNAVTGKKQKFSLPKLLPRFEELKSLKNKCKTDFIGVNYYTRAYIQWRLRFTGNSIKKVPFGLYFAKKNDRSSDLEWCIDAKGFQKILRRVAKYKLPIYITENGIADREDQYRGDYIEEHLKVLEMVQNQTGLIKGYYHWSLLDNFEWIKGYWPRFGLFAMDYKTFQRSPRPSAMIYADWIKTSKLNKP